MLQYNKEQLGDVITDINKFYITDNEKPLDNLVTDGGFAGIFRTICCIGDSLSSGEFESIKKDGERRYTDMFDYSWGQYMARMCGNKVYNFSRGGMTAKEYCDSFAEENGYWNKEYASQGYIIALGVNDLICQNMELGSVESADFSDWRNNKDDFAGRYAEIIQRIKEISPDAKIFLMTMPNEDDDPKNEAYKKEHAELLYAFAEKFSNTYVLDFYKYAPVYNRDFKNNFYLYGHLNPAGYILTAKMVASYIDYIIRKNPEDFKYVGFITTDILEEN